MPISKTSIAAKEKLEQVCELYHSFDHQHASAILVHAYPDLLIEICDVLLAFRIPIAHITKAGGNESEIPKALSLLLRPKGWKESKLTAKLVVDEEIVSSDTHKIDYVKGGVAFDLEWNSKDQTFDRDLFAFSTFFGYRRIGVGVLLTRDTSLNEIFRNLGSYVDAVTGNTKSYMAKYGASTTHMAKLLPRLRSGRSGGCPVLALGITPKQIDP